MALFARPGKVSRVVGLKESRGRESSRARLIFQPFVRSFARKRLCTAARSENKIFILRPVLFLYRGKWGFCARKNCGAVLYIWMRKIEKSLIFFATGNLVFLVNNGTGVWYEFCTLVAIVF